jgi:hypothetical protein
MSIAPSALMKILALEPRGTTDKVEAQFNPKELSQDKSIPWKPQKKKGPSDLEYTNCEPWSMSLELLFDGFENNDPPVIQRIEDLKKLTRFFGPKRDQMRPPKVRVLWGTGTETLPSFDAVIESVSVKYTMFSPDGKVLRATATVKLKEAADLKVGKRTD